MAWSWVQSCSNGSVAHVTSLGATFTTANLSSGTKLIAIVQSNATGNGACTGVSDGTNAFTKVADSGNGPTGFGGGQVWVLDTPAGDVGIKPTITASYDAATSCSLLVQEVSGLLSGTTGSLDGTAGVAHGETASGSFSSGTPSYTSGAASEYLLSAFVTDSNGGQNMILTGPAGYTTDSATLSNSNNASEVGAAYKNSTGGVESDGWSVSNANGSFQGWGVILVAFQLSATGTTVSGAVSALALAAPAGTPSGPGVGGPVSALALAAPAGTPAGSGAATIAGQVAALTLAAPAGVPSVTGFGGPLGQRWRIQSVRDIDTNLQGSRGIGWS